MHFDGEGVRPFDNDNDNDSRQDSRRPRRTVRTARMASVSIGLAVGMHAALAQAPIVPPQATPGVLQEQLRRDVTPQRPTEILLPALPPNTPSQPPPDSDNVLFTVRAVELTGNTVIPTTELAPQWSALVGQEVRLTQVYALADALTASYRNRGYVLSAVTVPQQTIRADGIVRLQVVEGYVGRVQFAPGFTPTARMQEEAEAIAREKPLTIRTLERQLLLINELPGVIAQAYFEPGTATGEALLTLNATRKSVSGFVGVQNRVSHVLGDVALEGRVTLNNPLGLDDSHSLLLQTTNRWRLKSVGYYYNQPLGTDGLAMNLFLGHVGSRIDSSGAAIKSDADIATLGVSYPLIRSRAESLRLRARLNYFNGQQNILDGLLVQEDRARALRLGAGWDRTDGSGVNFVDVEVSKGLSGLGATRTGAGTGADNAQRPDADYGFTKVNLFAGRLQQLGGNFSLQASVQGQWTNDPLPPSERAALGGELILRAFDAGELIGDRAYAGKLELRWEPALIPGGRITFYGYGETGRTVTLQRLLPNATQKGGSAGLGVRGTLANGTNLYAEVAKPLRRNVAYNDSRRARFFAGVSYEF